MPIHCGLKLKTENRTGWLNKLNFHWHQKKLGNIIQFKNQEGGKAKTKYKKQSCGALGAVKT